MSKDGQPHFKNFAANVEGTLELRRDVGLTFF